jgi:hypothetical protein
MAKVSPEKPPADNTEWDIGPWERPPDEDRALLLAAFERNHALDLADALGLLPQTRPDRPVVLDGPKTVACPRCGAAVGASCRSGNGQVGGFHVARQKEAA